MPDPQTALLDDGPMLTDMRQLGVTGLRRYSGMVQDEFLPQLVGLRGQRVWTEMSDNDPVCGGILYCLDKILRQVDWRAKAASQQPYDLDAQEFLESCMNDMRTTWPDTIGEILSFLPKGFSVHEIVYKRRAGRSDNPALDSKYSDGRVGWRDLPIRAQDTVARWHFSPGGDIIGFDQLAPPQFQTVTIPMTKALLFRTQASKNNPEGRSIFRAAYRPWFFKSRIENIEAVGCERELAGLPVAYVPPDVLSQKSGDAKRMYEAMRQLVTNIRQDAEAGVIFPLQYDASGNVKFKLELLSSGGARQFDTDKIVQRYDQRIAMSTISDFLLMGQSSSSTGSFAMHSDKTKLFALAASSFLDMVAAVFNNVAIPALFRLNSIPVSEYPTLEHGPVEAVDLGVLGAYLQALAAAGMPLFPNPDLEDELMRVAKLPPPLTALSTLGADQMVQPVPGSGDEPPAVQELHDAPAPGGEDGASERSVRAAKAPGEVKKKSGGGDELRKWDEADHPRGGGGQFGGGGGAPEPGGPGKAPTRAKLSSKATPEEKATLLNYQQEMTGMQAMLRGKAPEDAAARAAVTHLDSLMDKSTLPTASLQYRGMTNAHVAQAKVGDVLHDPGYMSVSAGLGRAKQFANQESEHGVVLHVSVPAGQHGIVVAQHISRQEAAVQNERETVLPRGTRLRVTHTETQRIGKHDKLQHVHVVIVGPEDT